MDTEPGIQKLLRQKRIQLYPSLLYPWQDILLSLSKCSNDCWWIINNIREYRPIQNVFIGNIGSFLKRAQRRRESRWITEREDGGGHELRRASSSRLCASAMRAYLRARTSSSSSNISWSFRLYLVENHVPNRECLGKIRDAKEMEDILGTVRIILLIPASIQLLFQLFHYISWRWLNALYHGSDLWKETIG